jgi:DNA polymerase-3 subunit epsilon
VALAGFDAGETIAVIDFETTGMTPAQGARATEIAAVLVRGGAVVGQYQSLMRSGVRVPPFIEQLTGISNAMLRSAPPAEQVMREVAEFARGCPLVAHNASFDRGFWLAERERAGCPVALPEAVGAPAGVDDPAQAFACTVLLSRRLYPEAPNHRLGTLARWHGLPDSGRAHRALADALTTAHLLLRIQRDVNERFAEQLAGRPVGHGLLARLQRANKAALERCVVKYAGTPRQGA